MSKDTSFDLTLDLIVEPDNTGERSKVVASLVIQDGSKPFNDVCITWHDLPDEGVDYIVDLFEGLTHGEMPLVLAGTSQKRVVRIQQYALKVLSKLNHLGQLSIGKTRQEKDQMNKALVKALGIAGKGKDHVNRKTSTVCAPDDKKN